MKMTVALAVAVIGWPTCLWAQVDLTPPIAKKPPASPIGNEMALRSARLRACLDRQALAVAAKPVDLETASVAVMARCGAELRQMRIFMMTGIPSFSPSPDFWEKEIEPVYMKEARKAVALARTRDAPPSALPPPPKVPDKEERNKI